MPVRRLPADARPAPTVRARPGEASGTDWTRLFLSLMLGEVRVVRADRCFRWRDIHYGADLPSSADESGEPLVRGRHRRHRREDGAHEHVVNAGAAVEASIGQHRDVEVQIGRGHRGHEHDGARGDAGEHEVRRAERAEQRVEAAPGEGADTVLGQHDVIGLRGDGRMELQARRPPRRVAHAAS
jgi:hypothetical protein